MSDGDDNPLGGRVTLGVTGVIVSLVGGVTLFLAVRYPSTGGLEAYGIGGVMGLAGAAAVVVAIVNPEWLDIGTRTEPSEAEKRERRIEGPLDDDD